MNGIKFLLDTNIIIGLYENNSDVFMLLKIKGVSIKNCAYSAVTRMELLSFPALTPTDKNSIELLLNNMVYLGITPEIEHETIEFRRLHKTKLPDSIIAATAKHHQLELLTLDKKLAIKLSLV
ncbi:MAG: type II toxin-antitoxin system VapC family toxin [Methylococcales bacterium]|nr:type II toxin-antitoxin system VapC family toxin [Methylococcales bacterium]